MHARKMPKDKKGAWMKKKGFSYQSYQVNPILEVPILNQSIRNLGISQSIQSWTVDWIDLIDSQSANTVDLRTPVANRARL